MLAPEAGGMDLPMNVRADLLSGDAANLWRGLNPCQFVCGVGSQGDVRHFVSKKSCVTPFWACVQAVDHRFQTFF